MNVSKEQYEKYIQPFFDKIYKLKNISKVDEVLIGDILINATNSEFQFDNLEKIILSLTKIQKDFFIQNGIKKELDDLIMFFEQEK